MSSEDGLIESRVSSELLEALRDSAPVMLGYVPLGMAFGLLFPESGISLAVCASGRPYYLCGFSSIHGSWAIGLGRFLCRGVHRNITAQFTTYFLRIIGFRSIPRAGSESLVFDLRAYR